MSKIQRPISVGRRIVVTGVAGSGKSTFSRALSAKTGIPIFVLDVHFWKPGWTKSTEPEWREKQRELLAGDDWIADGNYPDTLALRLERADTAVLLDTPWWVCVWRALGRGVRSRPTGFQLPAGCDESRWRRLSDEWCVAWRVARFHRSERETEQRILAKHGEHVEVYALRSKRSVREFLDT